VSSAIETRADPNPVTVCVKTARKMMRATTKVMCEPVVFEGDGVRMIPQILLDELPGGVAMALGLTCRRLRYTILISVPAAVQYGANGASISSL